MEKKEMFMNCNSAELVISLPNLYNSFKRSSKTKTICKHLFATTTKIEAKALLTLILSQNLNLIQKDPFRNYILSG